MSSSASGFHRVRQGEHVTRLAREYGFADYHTIWDDPHNADLKEQRKNPNVLFPGDQLYIPERTLGEQACATDNDHKFQKKEPKLRLRLQLETMYDRPLENAAGTLAIGNKQRDVTTDYAGRIDEPIPPPSEKVTLILDDNETPLEDGTVALLVGDLDPVEEVSGQLARLQNLGYYAGKIGGGDAIAVRSAVEEFQSDNKLTVDGICGPETRARLIAVHGC